MWDWLVTNAGGNGHGNRQVGGWLQHLQATHNVDKHIAAKCVQACVLVQDPQKQLEPLEVASDGDNSAVGLR